MSVLKSLGSLTSPGTRFQGTPKAACLSDIYGLCCLVFHRPLGTELLTLPWFQLRECGHCSHLPGPGKLGCRGEEGLGSGPQNSSTGLWSRDQGRRAEARVWGDQRVRLPADSVGNV